MSTLSQRESEAGSKCNDDGLNEFRELAERWKQRITLHNLNIAKRFLAGDIHVILHIRCKQTGEIWVVCFEKEWETPEPIGEVEAIGVRGEERAVLVDAVKIIEFPERIIPASVWLERVDTFYCAFTHALYLSSFGGFVSGLTLGDGKRCTGVRRVARSENQLPCKVVKCSPQIVDNITRTGKHIKGLTRHLYQWLIAPGGGIVLGSENVQCVVPELINENFELNEVLLGPLNFYPHEGMTAVGRKWHMASSCAESRITA